MDFGGILRSKVLTLQVKARRKTRKVIAVRQLGSTPVRLVRTTSRKAPKIKVLGLVRIILVTLAKLNSSTLKASPSLFKGGGARGWLPIKGAIFRSNTKTTAKAVVFIVYSSNGVSFISVSPFAI